MYIFWDRGYWTGWIESSRIERDSYSIAHLLLRITPVIISLGTLGNSFISISEVLTPSSVPNCESIPSVNSIRKNRTAHSCAAGNWLIASVKMMNANPVPDALCRRRYGKTEIIINELDRCNRWGVTFSSSFCRSQTGKRSCDLF